MNLSLAEYEARLPNITGGLHGVAYDVGAREIRLQSSMHQHARSPISVTLRLGSPPEALDYLVPQLTIGSSSCLPSDPSMALAQLQICQQVITQGLILLSAVESIQVYVGDVPCHFCGATGQGPCKPCHGTGVRVRPNTQTEEQS